MKLRRQGGPPRPPIACLVHAQDIIGVTIAILEIIADAFPLTPLGDLWQRTHTCTSQLPDVPPFTPYTLAWTDQAGGHATLFFDATPFDVDLELAYAKQIVTWTITGPGIEPRTGFFAPSYPYPAH